MARLSSAEERFEYWRRTVGLFAGPAASALVLLAPLPGLSFEAHRLAAVVSLVVVWWITEALPLAATGLAGAALAALSGVASAQDVFAPFADPIIFVFIGSFMIGRAIAEHGLDRRLAVGLLSLPIVGGRLSRVRLSVGVFGLLASGWVGNAALTAMMLPLAIGILGAVGRQEAAGRPYTIGFLLTMVYAISIGGMMTPVGTAPNLITIGLLDRVAGVRLDFFTWMSIGVPIGLVVGGLLFLLFNWLFPATGRFEQVASYLEREAGVDDAWTPGQRNCLVAFGVAVVLWLTPGFVAVFRLDATPLGQLAISRLQEGVVAIVAASLLFVLPIDWKARRFTIGWREAGQIDWGTILLFGAGLSLGRLMFETGLAATLGDGLIALSGARTLWTLTAMATVMGVVLTEMTSNTAATNMLVPIVLSMATAGGLAPVPPALGACLGAGMAFMLPISTPGNAMVYGTGRVPITAMMRYGLLLDVVSVVVIFVGLRVLCPLLGLT